MQRIRVDLPEPEGPQMTIFSPFSTARSMFFRTWKAPYHLLTPINSTADMRPFELFLWLMPLRHQRDPKYADSVRIGAILLCYRPVMVDGFGLGVAPCDDGAHDLPHGSAQSAQEVSRFRRWASASGRAGEPGMSKTRWRPQNCPSHEAVSAKCADVWSFKMIVRTISCRTAVLLVALAVADAAAAQQTTNQAEQFRQRELSAPDPIKNSLSALRAEIQEKKLQHGVGYTRILDQPRSTRLGDVDNPAADQGMAHERQPAGRAPAENRRGGPRRLPAAGPRPAQCAARHRPAEGGQLQRQLARLRLAHLWQGIARTAPGLRQLLGVRGRCRLRGELPAPQQPDRGRLGAAHQRLRAHQQRRAGRQLRGRLGIERPRTHRARGRHQ